MDQMDDFDYALLLMNMGGPTTESDVRPFLYNLFADHDIIQFPIPFLQPVFAWLVSRFRSAKVASKYQLIGGGSPILGLTQKQAVALENELKSSIKCKVYIAMRYSEPSTISAVKAIANNSHNRVVLLPLYPHFSSTTTMSSYHELERVMMQENIEWDTIKIMSWYDFPDYINALASLIKAKLTEFSDPNIVHLTFTAHSLPIRTIEKGDPYAKHISSTVEKVIDELALTNPFHICYQSKVGPVKWLSPSTEEKIKEIAANKDQDILMIPISFVSDHYETNYEIDILYAEQAKEMGIRSFKRINSLNDHPLFIKALSKLTLHHIAGGSS